MKTPASFGNLVTSIYDAVLQVDAWPEVLADIGLQLDSTWLVFGLVRLNGGAELNVQDSAGDPEHLALFNSNFTTPDANPAVRRMIAAKPGTLLLREQDMTDAEWLDSSLFREIYKPRGLYHGLGALVLKTDNHMAVLGVNRPQRYGTFSPRDLARLREIVPHLGRAIRMSVMLGTLQCLSEAHESLWDRATYGVVLVDRKGIIIWANCAASAILNEGDGLTIRGGRISELHAGSNANLGAVIDAALAVREGKATAGDGALAVSRPSGRRPYFVSVSPVLGDMNEFGRAPAAAIILTDPEAREETIPAQLVHLYGLTAREAALSALLMRGLDLHQAAEELAISRNTVRQHLRHVLDKTGTHRQAELVRLLLRGPAGLLPS